MLVSCSGPEADAPAEPTPASSATARSGPATVTVSTQRSTIGVPEDLRVRIETRIDPGFVLDGPAPGERLGEWTVLELTASPPRLGDDGATRRVYELVLEPFLAGSYEIPAIELAYRSLEGDQTGVVRSTPLEVQVTSVLDDDSLDVGAQRDVLDLPEPEPFAWDTAALIVIVGMSGLVLAMVALLVRSRLRREPSVFDGAMDRLDELEAGELDGAGARQAYREVAGLIRRCLAERLEPGAEHMTTQELGPLSEHWFGLTEADRSALRELLERLDRVNFAGGRADDAHAMLGEARGVLGRLASVSSMVVGDEVTGVSG